jgi:translation initiation factor 4E
VSFSKRVGDGSGFGKPAQSATTPGSALPSPGAAAFGLGSGAFASFGVPSSAKTPKTPGNPFDLAMGQIGAKSGAEKGGKEKVVAKAPSMAAISETGVAESVPQSHPLRNKWVFWWRPPIQKGQAGFMDYEKTIHAMCHCSTAEEFMTVYSYLKRPSTLPIMSEYHFFKYGIRPIWEDEVNKEGGKWVIRIKKGVADRYWELLVLALSGDQFGDAGDEVCGAVVSVRNGEDIISIWTRNSGGRVLKIRWVHPHRHRISALLANSSAGKR